MAGDRVFSNSQDPPPPYQRVSGGSMAPERNIPLQPVARAQAASSSLPSERAQNDCQFYRCPIHMPEGSTASPYLLLRPFNFPCSACLRNWRESGTPTVNTLEEAFSPTPGRNDYQDGGTPAVAIPEQVSDEQVPAQVPEHRTAVGRTAELKRRQSEICGFLLIVGINLISLAATVNGIVQTVRRSSLAPMWVLLVGGLTFTFALWLNCSILEAEKELRLVRLREAGTIEAGSRKLPKKEQRILNWFWCLAVGGTVLLFAGSVIILLVFTHFLTT